MKSTNTILKIFTGAIALSLTVGCLSEEEKEARRAWAYDLSGAYDEAREADVATGEVEIENETSKNDIKVVFTRGDLYAGEQEYLDLVADEAERTALREQLVLGEGESEVQEGLVGGENISDDFGESSQFSVGSPQVDATPKLEGATDAKLHYSMTATIVNNSDELRGALVVHYQDRRPDPEDETETKLHTESETFEILLKRRDGPIEGDVCDDCTSGPADDDGASSDEPAETDENA